MKRKKTRETIAIVGPGRLGIALAEALKQAGHEITEVIGRQRPRSLARARTLARRVGATASSSKSAELDADVIWFCVPDARITEATMELSRANWLGKIALHSSGALASDALIYWWRRGASVAAVHPLMTFVDGSTPELKGVPFAVEGDAAALEVAGRIVRELGGSVFRIRKQDKTAYHAFATMICPLLVSLLAASEKVAALAGIPGREARRRMMPIIRQTISNYEWLGAGTSFSGPIARGDAETIAQHLAVLEGTPEARSAYIALASAALKHLPSKNRKQISELLNGPRKTRRNQSHRDQARKPSGQRR